MLQLEAKAELSVSVTDSPNSPAVNLHRTSSVLYVKLRTVREDQSSAWVMFVYDSSPKGWSRDQSAAPGVLKDT